MVLYVLSTFLHISVYCHGSIRSINVSTHICILSWFYTVYLRLYTYLYIVVVLYVISRFYTYLYIVVVLHVLPTFLHTSIYLADGGQWRQKKNDKRCTDTGQQMSLSGSTLPPALEEDCCKGMLGVEQLIILPDISRDDVPPSNSNSTTRILTKSGHSIIRIFVFCGALARKEEDRTNITVR